MRKRVWISASNVVLVALRDYQDGKADIIHRYDDADVRILASYGEIPRDLMKADDLVGNENEDDDADGQGGIVFQYADDTIVDLAKV